MKKLALAVVLSAISTMTFAGGCWVNGKYQQCVKHSDSTSQQSPAL